MIKVEGEAPEGIIIPSQAMIPAYVERAEGAAKKAEEIANNVGQLTGVKGVASQAEAEAGAVNDKIMTPLMVKQVADKYLPLSGGTMNGGIKYGSNAFRITGNATNGEITIFSGSEYTEGACLFLCGKDSSGNGKFALTANNDNMERVLRGLTNGSLTWDEKEIERIEAKGTNYIRYSNGLQICWSGEIVITADGNYQWNYPLPFVDYRKYSASLIDNNNAIRVNGRSASNLQIKVTGLANPKASYAAIAIGMWK